MTEISPGPGRIPPDSRARIIASAVVLLCTWILPTAVLGDVHPNAGTAAFPFLEAGYDARAIAMGDAVAAMPNDVAGLFGNPSAMGFSTRRQVLLGFRPVILDIMGTPLAAAFPLRNAGGKSLGVLAGSGVYLSQGSVTELDQQGQETGIEWNAFSSAGGVSWAMQLWEELGVGASVKGLYDRMGSEATQYSARGLAFDLGAQYRLLKSHLIIGIAMRNLGVTLSGYTDDYDDMPLPLQAMIGISYQLRYLPNLRLAFDLNNPYDNYLTGRLGGELDVYKDILTVRAGYAASRVDLQEAMAVLGGESDDSFAKSDWSGLRLGLGVNTTLGAVGVRIDAAYQVRVDNIQPTFVLSSIVSF